LIGDEMRRRELERELRELDKRRLALDKEHKETAADLADLAERRSRLTLFRTLLQEIGEDLPRQRDAVAQAVHQLVLAQSDLVNARENCQYHEEAHQQATVLLEDILLSMKKAGLEGLEERIRDVERKWQRLRTEVESNIRESGRIEQTVKNIRAFCEEKLSEVAATRAERDDAQARLLALVAPDGPVDVFVQARCGAAADSRSKLKDFAAAAKEYAAVTAEKSSPRRAVRSIAFGFVYD
jgi:chromosome segregation ATPase